MRKIKYAPKMVCAKKSYVKKIMCTKSYAHKKVMRKKSYVQKKLWAKKVMRQLLVCEYFFNLQLLSLIVNSCRVGGVCWPLELATGRLDCFQFSSNVAICQKNQLFLNLSFPQFFHFFQNKPKWKKIPVSQKNY